MTHRVVVLTGAGISAESGLKTFRDNNGLWETHRMEDVATPEAFARDPSLVYRFYNLRRKQLQGPDVLPNAGHQALARLEEALQDDFLLVTQNVDDLHERAGSNRIIHMHGELLSARCCHSGYAHRWTGLLDSNTPCPCCRPASSMRPDIVWFGEMPMRMHDIMEAISQADTFVAIGTSGQVYPAAGFVDLAHQHGARTVELNLAPSDGASAFGETRYGPATQVVSQWVDDFLRDCVKG